APLCLGPAVVLRLQDVASLVAQADQGGQALAGMRAARSECSPAVDNGNALSFDALANHSILVDEKAALADRPLRLLGSESWRRLILHWGRLRRSILGQPANCVLE